MSRRDEFHTQLRRLCDRYGVICLIGAVLQTENARKLTIDNTTMSVATIAAARFDDVPQEEADKIIVAISDLFTDWVDRNGIAQRVGE